MIGSFLLGLSGSLAHCLGMCSAVVVLLGRHSSFREHSLAWVLAHAGRITTYGLLGALFGLLGQSLWMLAGSLPRLQGGLSLLFAVSAFYMAFAWLGYARPVEWWFSGWISAWGQAMRRLNAPAPFLAGMLWGLLPCGLVFMALIPAATSGNALQGALNMMVFGVATLPGLIAVRWLTQKTFAFTWWRNMASLVMMVFGTQLAMRGFAAWGWIPHWHVGPLMFW